MPVVRELFGHSLTDSGQEGPALRTARCPHMAGRLCDGGGNRDMMRWPAEEQPIAALFEESVGQKGRGYIPCGVCSVLLDRPWAVCPRRLLTFDAPTPSDSQRLLRERVLRLAGFDNGDVVRVWSEVTLRDQSGLNYRLDYVLRSESRPPVIVEVMTASTSGGNKRRRTDMKSAFCDAVLFANGVVPDRRQSPGVNTRQVWARMASQLIVKSEIANRWGGCAIWVVQDALMAYIGSQTGLDLAGLRSDVWETDEVNVVSASIDDPEGIELYAGPVQSKTEEAAWTQLLSAPSIPDVTAISDRLTDARLTATLTLQ